MLYSTKFLSAFQEVLADMEWQQLTATTLMQWLGQWWWAFVRISAVLWIAPIFSDYKITARIRIILAFLLALMSAHLLPKMPMVDPFSLATLLITTEQIIFGLLFGLCLHALFFVLTMAGQILSQQMGLSMAVISDPVNGESDPLISELLYILCVLLFFSLNGHLVMLDVLVESLRQWPPGRSLYDLDLMKIPALIGWSIGAALVLSLPTIAAMLLVNITFGVMNRSAPAFNIFSLGFPMSMMAGLIAFGLSLSAIPSHYMDFSWFVLSALRDLGVTP
nr:flagellar biosynthetic protein FliR [uncultured Tolumonas sp.]